MNNSIRKSVSKTPVSVDSIYSLEFQKEGTKTAMLRQTVTTTSFYPSKQVKNELSDNPFSQVDFGFEDKEYSHVEKRVAFLTIPEAIDSPEDVLAKLSKDSCIYKILSNRPIITENQQYAISKGLRTMEDYAIKQLAVYGPNSDGEEGQPILDSNDKPQYKVQFFSNSPKEDIDKRTVEAEDFYTDGTITAMLTGQAATIKGQEIF